MRGKIIIFTGFIFVNIFFAHIQEAQAIPTFARKYRTSCTTCHTGFYKTNPFGEAFRQNGYQIPGGDAAYVKEEPVSLGAPAWKKVWPRADWPGTIPSAVPISFNIHQRVFIDEGGNPNINFKLPHEIRLFIAGTFDEPFSFYGDYSLQTAALNRLFFQFNDMFLEDSWGKFGFLSEDALNLRIGRLDVGAIGFPKPMRRTMHRALPYTYNVADGWDIDDLQSGFEANGLIKSRFKYALGVVNGTGGGTPSGVLDENNEKDVYGRVAYKFGGMSFDGKTVGHEAELKQTDNYVDNAVTLGLFGYWGKSKIGSGGSAWENPFRRLGFDYRFNFGKLDFYGASIWGVDKSPASTVTGTTRGSIGEVDTNSWFTEADYVFYSWLTAALGYEQVTYDKGFSRDLETIYASLMAWPRANIRLGLEGSVFPDSEDGKSQLLVDLTYSF